MITVKHQNTFLLNPMIKFAILFIVINNNSCSSANKEYSKNITKNENDRIQNEDHNIQIKLDPTTFLIDKEQDIKFKVLQGNLQGYHVKNITIKKKEDGKDYSKEFDIQKYYNKSAEELCKNFLCKPSQYLPLGDYLLTLTLEQEHSNSIIETSCHITLKNSDTYNEDSNKKQDVDIEHALTIELTNTYLILNQEASFTLKFDQDRSLIEKYIIQDITLKSLEQKKKNVTITNLFSNNKSSIEETWGLSTHIGQLLTNSCSFIPKDTGRFELEAKVGEKGNPASTIIKKCRIEVLKKTPEIKLKQPNTRIYADIENDTTILFPISTHSANLDLTLYYIHDILIQKELHLKELTLEKSTISFDIFGIQSKYIDHTIKKMQESGICIHPAKDAEAAGTYTLSMILKHRDDTSFQQRIEIKNIIVRPPLELNIPEFIVLDNRKEQSIPISLKHIADYTDYCIGLTTTASFSKSTEESSNTEYLFRGEETPLLQKRENSIIVTPEKPGIYKSKVTATNKNDEKEFRGPLIYVFDFEDTAFYTYPEYSRSVDLSTRKYILNINSTMVKKLKQEGYKVKNLYQTKTINKILKKETIEFEKELKNEITFIIADKDINREDINSLVRTITLIIQKDKEEHTATYDLDLRDQIGIKAEKPADSRRRLVSLKDKD